MVCIVETLCFHFGGVVCQLDNKLNRCFVFQVTKTDAYIECFSNKRGVMRRMGRCVHDNGRRSAGCRPIEVPPDLSQLLFGHFPRSQPASRDDPWYKKQRTDLIGVRQKAEELIRSIMVADDEPPASLASAGS